MSAILAPAHLCPTCRAPIIPTREPARLPCGHTAFITASGVVVGWADSVGCALNLERVLNSWEAGRAMAARYPVADESLPLGEQMEANERTLQAAIRERSARQHRIAISTR